MNKNYHVRAIPRMFEQVTRQIVDFITFGKLSPNSKLPTERQLSESLQVSRSSIREGLRILELLGYLSSRQGEGTFVSSPPSFLIPGHVLNHKIEAVELDRYFEIALMCVEKIVFLSLEKMKTGCITFPMPNDGETDPFWNKFMVLITSLGEQLSNPYYVSLFSHTFELLNENGYFLAKEKPFDFSVFRDALLAGNRGKTADFLMLLSAA
ncbi:FadR/GntR family transcriptional regulator [Aneurinibacillus tyrosinisolvens]|uniref:FadR/GntR family transcriptional regulator n=1 Tax=Aneurinibacillus tyrosinisolvens TaxID=1443435 RepID=UPI00063F9FE3|nr:GntR family transcriptional regulator [Aneurinibacillus tyrosinisolvens]